MPKCNEHPASEGLAFVYRYQQWRAAEDERRDLETQGRYARVWPVEADGRRMFELWAESEAR